MQGTQRAESNRLECPFFLNVFGKDQSCNIDRVLRCVPQWPIWLRDRSLDAWWTRRPDVLVVVVTEVGCRHLPFTVETEMLPAHVGSVSTLKGTEVTTFLKSKGIVISASATSRLKQSIDDKLHGDRVESYQKLGAYLALMTDKNPGSIWLINQESDGATFKRVCSFPSAGIHVTRHSKPLSRFDGVHLKGEMHQRASSWLPP